MIARVGNLRCAILLGHVVETMRPLPVEPVGGAPPFVRGLSIIRGNPTLVIDTARLLGHDSAHPPTRFVVVRVRDRSLAMMFDEVIDVRPLARSLLGDVPALIRHAAPDAIAAIGAADAAVLVLLESTLVVPPELLQRMETQR